MVIASSYPLLEVFWTMLIFFAFVVWMWILFSVLADLFRRHDTTGVTINQAEFEQMKQRALAT